MPDIDIDFADRDIILDKLNHRIAKLDTGKKGRMRKDRYSALVIANMIARSMQRAIPAPTYVNVGRLIGQGGGDKGDGRMYVGPEWANSYTPGTCFMVKKNNEQ